MTVHFIEAITDVQALAVLSLIEASSRAPAWRHRQLHAALRAAHTASLPARVGTSRSRLFEVMAGMSAVAEDPVLECGPRASSLARVGAPGDENPDVVSGRTDGGGAPSPGGHRLNGVSGSSCHGIATAGRPRRRPRQSPGPACGFSCRCCCATAWTMPTIHWPPGPAPCERPVGACPFQTTTPSTPRWPGLICRRCSARHGCASPASPPSTTPACHCCASPAAAARPGSRPERIDVEFPPAALDLRIRRAGFDINPGFVPWLGRIVHFHYPS